MSGSSPAYRVHRKIEMICSRIVEIDGALDETQTEKSRIKIENSAAGRLRSRSDDEGHESLLSITPRYRSWRSAAWAGPGRNLIAARMPSTMKSPNTKSCVSLNGGSVCVGASACRAVFFERLHDADEDIEIESDHGTDDIDPTPVAGELPRVTREDRDCEHKERHDAQRDSRRETMKRKEKAVTLVATVRDQNQLSIRRAATSVTGFFFPFHGFTPAYRAGHHVAPCARSRDLRALPAATRRPLALDLCRLCRDRSLFQCLRRHRAVVRKKYRPCKRSLQRRLSRHSRTRNSLCWDFSSCLAFSPQSGSARDRPTRLERQDRYRGVMDSKIRGLHHLTAIATTRSGISIFYAGLLGLRFVKRTVNFDDPGTYHFYFGDWTRYAGDDPDIFSVAGRAARNSGHRANRSDGVRNFTETQLATGWSASRSITSLPRKTSPRFGEEVIRFSDSDGLLLELIARVLFAPVEAWPDSPIPAEHALQGFHSVSPALEGYESTANYLRTASAIV